MARLLDQLRGHQLAMKGLLNQIEHNHLSSCLLFTGPAGIGKRLAAKALAQVLSCETLSHEACGNCGSCRRIAQGEGESILEVRPSNNQIKIDEARAIGEFFNLQKISKARVVIIDEAELLNPQAGNSLLKTLEEPPPESYIFLISSAPWRLLPTILSRAVRVNFRPLSVEELRLLTPNAPDWALHAAFGQVGRVQELVEWGQKGYRDDALFILRMMGEKPIPLFDERMRKIISDRNGALVTTRHLVSYLRDMMFLSVGPETQNLINFDQKDHLTWCLEHLPGRIDSWFKKAQGLEALLKQNVDPQLAFENFILESSC